MMIGSEVIKLELTSSTNGFLKELHSKSAVCEGTVVVANEQSEGRGQQGNRWESKAGENILMSVILFPEGVAAQEQFILSKMVSLAVADTILGLVDKVKIKWPNDIYILNRKVCGILIENVIKGTEISECIVGIGLNVNQLKFSALPFATSLSIETGKVFPLDDILSKLCNSIENRYQQLKHGLTEELNADYLEMLYKYMEYSDYQSNNVVFKARIIGISHDGRLILEIKNTGEIKLFAFKEVQFLHEG